MPSLCFKSTRKVVGVLRMCAFMNFKAAGGKHRPLMNHPESDAFPRGRVTQKARERPPLSTYHGDYSMFRKARNYRQAYWWPRCGAYARSTGLPCQRKVERDEDGRPKARCWNHGGAPGSGQQSEQGRRNIGEFASRRMKAFWADWKAKGSPPIVRGCVKVGQPKPAATATPTSSAERRARAITELKRRWPDRDWD